MTHGRELVRFLANNFERVPAAALHNLNFSRRLSIKASDESCAEVYEAGVEIHKSEGPAGLERHLHAVHVAKPEALLLVDDVHPRPRRPAGLARDADHSKDTCRARTKESSRSQRME